MIRCLTAPVGSAAAAMVAAVATLSCLMVSARAETTFPASASIVRNAVVALSLADAALLVANAVVPPSSAVIKSGTADAMASMRTASARRYAAAYSPPVYDRRIRAYRDPFLLILGVAY